VHIIGSIGCLIVAGILATVVFGNHDPLPGWVVTLATVTMGIMLVSAARIYVLGARRKRAVEGPRTKIILTDLPPPPPRPKSRPVSSDD
jgi:hypothetical protein